MQGFVLGILSALWLGILTSIGPCSMATNIAAISFIDRRIGRTRMVFWTGLLYTVGRMLTYIVLGILFVTTALSIPQVSYLLQKYMNKLLGPVLIIVGMILLELISFNLSGSGVSEKMQKRIESLGIYGAGLLGIIFAMSFCPVSAALFFGSLIPLSLKYDSGFILPALYGLGTGLPVFIFAVLLAFGAQSIGKAFNKLTRLEWWIRRATGVVFVLIGFYYCLTYIFGIFK
ncbi:MAG: sulfite exporter TauE/SafE family protein [Planctomycetes bacterium]|nr:sulfite exporter TauE/SafE family protein [Planctomycetota bacterium]